MDAYHPPAAYYAHAPKGLIARASPENVDKLCGRHTYACAVLHGATINGKGLGCLVVVPYGAPRWVIDHEIAHCNGWRHRGDT